jgi:hypothetical protein
MYPAGASSARKRRPITTAYGITWGISGAALKRDSSRRPTGGLWSTSVVAQSAVVRFN